MQCFSVACVLLLVIVAQTMAEPFQQDHQSHNKKDKEDKKQMRKYVGEYIPAQYQDFDAALLKLPCSSGSSMELLEQAPHDNKKEKEDKKQMRNGKDGNVDKVKSVNHATFLSGNLQDFTSFNSASLVFAAFMGAMYFFGYVVFKKRSTYQAVSFPESLLG